MTTLKNFNILRESFLKSLEIKKQRLIKLRDERMVFFVHVQIKSLNEDIKFVQDMIKGKCYF